MDPVTRLFALDEAWTAVEAALPDYWYIRSLTLLKFDLWEVVAADGDRMQFARGRTPTEALVKLAVLFRP